MKPLDRLAPHAEDFFDLSAMYMTLWHGAALRQVFRLRDNKEADAPRLIDSIFLAIALHNFKQATSRYVTELDQTVGRGSGSRKRRKACQEAVLVEMLLDSELPQIRDLRDLFSHLEEYGFGVGRHQPSGAPIRVTMKAPMLTVSDSDRVLELNLDVVERTLDEAAEGLMESFLLWEPPDG